MFKNIFSRFSIDSDDNRCILREQADAGRWQNDIKGATVKCKAEYGITRLLVSANPTDLGWMGIVSQSIGYLTDSKKYGRLLT